MMKRICPKCKKDWYSSNTNSKIWICDNCGARISKDQESPAISNRENSDIKEIDKEQFEIIVH